MSHRICTALLSLLAPAALAQTTPNASPRWLLGARLGINNSSWYENGWYLLGNGTTILRPATGLNVGRYWANLRLSVHAEAQHEWRRPPHYPRTYLSYAVLPVYLRTGRPGGRFHLLLGGGRAWLLSPLPPPALQLTFISHDTFGLLGAELRLGPEHARHTTTIGLQYRVGTFTYRNYRHSPGGSRYMSYQQGPQTLSLTVNHFLLR